MLIKNNFFLFKSIYSFLKPGVAGFEPTNDGVKVRSLTAWRHPKIFELKIQIYVEKFQDWARRDSNP